MNQPDARRQTPAPAAPASQPAQPGRRPVNGFDTGIVLDFANTLSPDSGTAILTLTNQVVDVAGTAPADGRAAAAPARAGESQGLVTPAPPAPDAPATAPRPTRRRRGPASCCTS